MYNEYKIVAVINSITAIFIITVFGIYCRLKERVAI